MKVSFVRTKPEEPIKTQFKDLVPGEWYTVTPGGDAHRQKLRGYTTHDGFIEKDSYVFFNEADWTEVYPVNQPEPPKPSWDDFKPGWAAKIEMLNGEVTYCLLREDYESGPVTLLFECGYSSPWDLPSLRSRNLLELYPPGSGYLKIEI